MVPRFRKVTRKKGQLRHVVFLSESDAQVGLPARGRFQSAKRMMHFCPRVTAALCAASLLVSILALSGPAAFAQSGEVKPDQSATAQSAEAAKNGQKIDELAEAAKALSGPAGNAECVWLGRRVVSLLWRDDLDTAFRHLDLYDRFGCPASHIQATFRCVVQHGPFDSKAPDSLGTRIHTCWLNPGPAGQQEAPAATIANPARR